MQEETAEAQAAADWDHDTPASAVRRTAHPPRGFRVVEITVADGSPAGGVKLSDISWPPGCVPVSLLHNRSLRQPSPEEVVSFGDRINLLIRDP